jgi:hypothetical protein
MVILGAVFRCLQTTVTAAACLSSKPLFLSPMDKRDEATTYAGFLKAIIWVLIGPCPSVVERSLRPLGVIC